jgi:hypothetical protein
VTSYTDPGFGHFLSSDADLLAAYRWQTGAYLTDTPRVVDVWRMRGAAARDRFSPAEAERWLQAQPGTGAQDIAELRALASVWMNQAQPSVSPR